MWITLFSIVIGIALGLAMGAVVMESGESGGKAPRQYGRRSARGFRVIRNS